MAVGRALRIIIDERKYRLAPGQDVIIGRDGSAGIAIPGVGLSRHHVWLHDSPSGWVLEDLNSSNGTWIAGRRVYKTTIDGFVLVTLGRPGEGVVVALEPVPVSSQPPTPPPATRPPSQPLLPLGALAAGILLIAVGVFALDWYRADIVLAGQPATTTSMGLELDGDGLGLAAAALGGVIGILGIRSSVSPRPLGLIVLLTAVITAATTLYLMFGPPADDESISVPGLTATAEVSADVGGFITLAGATAIGIAGFALLIMPGTLPSGARH
jgi:FHA domain